MDLRKKVLLEGIFSITIFIMAAAIVRVTGARAENFGIGQGWIFAWTGIGMGVGQTPFLQLRRYQVSNRN